MPASQTVTAAALALLPKFRLSASSPVDHGILGTVPYFQPAKPRLCGTRQKQQRPSEPLHSQQERAGYLGRVGTTGRLFSPVVSSLGVVAIVGWSLRAPDRFAGRSSSPPPTRIIARK